MASVTLRDVRKAFDQHRVLHGIDLHVEDGEFCVFVGPSGCGKSTLLRLICGLDDVTAGELAIESELVNDVPPAKRGVAMVFQSYALYPHMTVAQNMGYALRLARYDKADIRERVSTAAGVLQLTDYLDRKPKQLSGGQRQRVAIGRAIVREPRVFLFDEPLSNLDAALRVEMRLEIARLKARLGTTMIYVTHDQIEAMTLADKIVVMNAGRIEQIGSPLELYTTPRSRFVAGFIGSPRMNFLPIMDVGSIDSGVRLQLGNAGAVDLPYRLDRSPSEFGVRPEHVRFAAAGAPNTLSGQVGLSEHLGSDTYAYVDLDGHDAPVLVRVSGEIEIDRGDRVGLQFPPDNTYLIDGEGAVIHSPGVMAERKAA